MCDCITRLEHKAKEHLASNYTKPIRETRMKGIVFPLVDNTIEMRTCNYIEVELEGQKKRDQVPFHHNYCPFCGDSYSKKIEVSA